jgi:hypothetical protein
MKLSLICISFLFLFSLTFFAQDVSFSENRGIYSFLINLSIKGYIVVNDETLPWSRQYIADKLIEAEIVKTSLTWIEKKELDYYLDEYSSEIERSKNLPIFSELHYLVFEKPERFRFFHYSDSLLNFYTEPIFGYGINRKNGENQLEKHTGINIYGTLNQSIRFKTTLLDNQEQGGKIDGYRVFSTKNGFGYRRILNNSIQYDFVNAQITYGWKWGQIGIAKDYIQWGSGESGQLIFSDKAPSFPFIRLNINPVSWFEFTYIHGFLDSEIADSNTIRININNKRFHFEQIPKYIAAHLFTFKPIINLSFSLGESVVYSDQIEPIFFIPIISLRLAEHYIANRDNNKGGNAQIFADIRYKSKELKSLFYASLFLDEMSFSSLFKYNGYTPTEAAYTLGIIAIDPLFMGSKLILEYTKIMPYVYVHSDNAQFYSNCKYQLGHWIGSNGDLIYSAYDQMITRSLNLKFWGDYIRKGYEEKIASDIQYPYPEFLYGPRKNVMDYGINVSWEPWYSLILTLNYQHSKITDEDKTRTPAYELGSRNSLGISFSYGL